MPGGGFDSHPLHVRYEKRHQHCRDQGHLFIDTQGREWRSGDLAHEEGGGLLQLVHLCNTYRPDSKQQPWWWERMSDEYAEYADQKEVFTFID